ncbi:MAG: PD40 domain-containing protein [Anaerolineae bacterium]|nr:PD40 domain-containing protein [Anaerolineae bacterium]
MRNFLISICSLIILCTGYVIPSSAATVYRYAYIINSGDAKELALILLDSTSPQAHEQRQIPIPTDRQFQFFGAIPSPTGEWIALPFQSPEGTKLQLYNILSSEIFDVVDGSFPLRDINGLPDQHIVWSPDGKNLAFLAVASIDDKEPTGGVFIYSVDTQNILKLVDETSFYARLAWSADSKLLAISKRECSDTQRCEFSLSVADINIGSVTQSVNIPFLDFGAASYIGVDTLCSLAWSPDSRYISFVSICSYEPSPIPKEVYVWDTQSEELTPLTSFTTAIQIPQDGMFSVGFYSVAWITANTLLVGGVWGTNTSLQSGTFLAHVADKTMAEISVEAVEQWAIAPTRQKAAYRSTTAVDAERLVPDPPKLNISDIGADSSLSNSSTTATNACHLSWSPDSTTLAYTFQTDLDSFGRSCTLAPLGIGLIDDSTKQTVEYSFTSDERSKGVVIVGWVHMQ